MHELVIITGGGSGYGRVLARQYAHHVLTTKTQGEHFLYMLLTGRNETTLHETHLELKSFDDSVLHVATVSCDFAHSVRSWLPHIQTTSEQLIADRPIERATLIHNAGSLGDISKTISELDSEEIEEHIRSHLISCMQLSSWFLKEWTLSKPKTNHRQIRIINISSLMGIQAHKYYGLYCTGKAARNMFHQVISEEYGPNICKTLNYAPGPMDNRMTRIIQETCGDPVQRQWIKEAKTKGSLVNMEDSAIKLILLLDEDTFESGSHVDYYDI